MRLVITVPTSLPAAIAAHLLRRALLYQERDATASSFPLLLTWGLSRVVEGSKIETSAIGFSLVRRCRKLLMCSVRDWLLTRKKMSQASHVLGSSPLKQCITKVNEVAFEREDDGSVRNEAFHCFFQRQTSTVLVCWLNIYFS